MSAMSDALAAAQDAIGTEIGLSDWITVDQTMIDAFAATTRDDQWIHIDEERASKTEFGGTIAHGFLTLSLASRFAYDALGTLPGQVMGVNYGMNKLRFVTPVKAGARMRGRFVLQGASARGPNQMLRETHLTIEIAECETPALVAEWLGLVIFAD
ncbi:MaoC family dehydratase [Sulfitobacter sp. S190]|uniref:MaoC family dehydratase n=1 Tax=Sulfitobacter sp. S190 TaxID=2867022 RepID=UPI0021A3FD23|nr:MaoC family dehydratase [Sulfitobacter sp. S190]UWR24332.1 MaoC family dehydratase [Sulfitobacter sp. S190]